MSQGGFIEEVIFELSFESWKEINWGKERACVNSLRNKNVTFLKMGAGLFDIKSMRPTGAYNEVVR